MIEINCSTKTKDYDCSNVNEVLALVASISGTLEQKKSDTNLKKSDKYRFVLEAGLEPARAKSPQDFKSGVSTNSTTRASSDLSYFV